MARTSLLLGLILSVALAGAVPAPAFSQAVPPSQPAAQEPTLEAEVRPEVLRGLPVVVPITVGNPGPAPLSFPDIQSRPWLVHFQLKDGKGRSQTRHTTAPASDPGTRWTLAPGARRRVWVEIPSGAALEGDRYELGIQVLDGEKAWTVAPTTIQVRPIALAAADLAEDDLAVSAMGWMSPWVQKTATGADLYLRHGSPEDPSSRPDHWWLASLPAPITPALTACRPQDAWSRAIVWQDGENALWYARLQAQGLRSPPRRVGLPWPSWRLLDRGVTDASGVIHVPVWIDAPRAPAGEVRVVTVDERGSATYRAVVRMERPPVAFASTADAGGQLRMAVLYDGKIDVYTVRQGQAAELPASGRKVFRPGPVPAGQAAPDPYVGLRLDTLVPTGTGTEATPGGLAVFAWATSRTETEQRVWGTWFSLEGRRLLDAEGVAVPLDGVVRQVLPGSGGPLVAVVESRSQVQAWSARWDEPVTLSDLESGDRVRLQPDGHLYVVRSRPAAGITVRRVEGR